MLDYIRELKEKAQVRIAKLQSQADAAIENEAGYIRALTEVEDYMTPIKAKAKPKTALPQILADLINRQTPLPVEIPAEYEPSPLTLAEEEQGVEVAIPMIPPFPVNMPDADFSGDIPVDILQLIKANPDHRDEVMYHTAPSDWISILRSGYPEYAAIDVSEEDIIQAFDSISEAIQEPNPMSAEAPTQY